MTHKFQINNNGDSADTIKGEFREVMNAARALREALQAVTVNGRNYQTLGADSQGALTEAGAERAAFAQQIEDIRLWAESGAIRALNQQS